MSRDPRNPCRLAEGGQIDRDAPLSFRFNGTTYRGYRGDTLASALLANGVRVVARSFKYHRPRGILSAGEEEPCALVEVGEGAARVPNSRATLVPLEEGLVVLSQNGWPALGFDLGRIVDFTHPLWPAGFYNKTFKWPGWHTWEGLVRRAAGLGRPLPGPDPDRYEPRASDTVLDFAGHYGTSVLPARPLKPQDKAKVESAVQLVERWILARLRHHRFETVHEVDDAIAQAFGITQVGQIMVMVHTGSRGCGHQICTDFLDVMQRANRKYGIPLVDRELACAPASSPEAQSYFAAMKCGANFAWANRQMITHWIRESFEQALGQKAERMGLHLVYDIAHNMAKLEQHEIDGKRRWMYVHRKGATRAFGPGHPDISERYRKIGQPVIIPGDMGRASWVLVGQTGSMEQTFGTCCHGAGRRMSRTAAVKHAQGRRSDQELAAQGVIARARSWRGLAEEQPAAYKDVNLVVDVVHRANLASKVARMRPIGVVKG